MQDDPYYYQGTQTLKNRFGVRDEAALEELEAAAYICRRTQPAPGFTPDLAGLKSAHRHLFKEIYEWAGKTRQERVTIDGRSFWPSPFGLPKEEMTFWPRLLGRPFEERLLWSREAMDDVHRDGNLTWRLWANYMTEQVATIYEARPFKCGNDQAMRRYVELAAEHYGLRVRIPGGQKLSEAAHTAAISGDLHGLWSLLAYNTHATCLENEQNGSKSPESKAEQGESDRTTAMRAASAETAPLIPSCCDCDSLRLARLGDDVIHHGKGWELCHVITNSPSRRL